MGPPWLQKEAVTLLWGFSSCCQTLRTLRSNMHLVPVSSGACAPGKHTGPEGAEGMASWTLEDKAGTCPVLFARCVALGLVCPQASAASLLAPCSRLLLAGLSRPAAILPRLVLREIWSLNCRFDLGWDKLHLATCQPHNSFLFFLLVFPFLISYGNDFCCWLSLCPPIGKAGMRTYQLGHLFYPRVCSISITVSNSDEIIYL